MQGVVGRNSVGSLSLCVAESHLTGFTPKLHTVAVEFP